MSFGLRNAAQKFQRLIDEIFRGLPFVYAYKSDVFIANTDMEEQKIHLEQTFHRLSNFRLKIKNELKCIFEEPKMNFPVHEIDQ